MVNEEKLGQASAGVDRAATVLMCATTVEELDVQRRRLEQHKAELAEHIQRLDNILIPVTARRRQLGAAMDNISNALASIERAANSLKGTVEEIPW